MKGMLRQNMLLTITSLKCLISSLSSSLKFIKTINCIRYDENFTQ
nr:hypothetical protein [Clostridium botulinum]